MSVVCHVCHNRVVLNRRVPESVPFRCSECGMVDFEYGACKDIVFIYPDRDPEQLGRFYLPPKVRSNYRNEYGYVLSSGPGYYNKKTGRLVVNQLKPGMRVAYDKSVPWSMRVKAEDGKTYRVVYMGETDVLATVDERVGKRNL